MAILSMDLLTRVTIGRKRGTSLTREAPVQIGSMDHHVSACSTYKQGMKAKSFSLDDEDASEVDHEDFMRGVIARFGPRCFFCNLEGNFNSDCPQFCKDVADIKHPV